MTTTENFDPVVWLDGLPKDASITDAEVRRMWELGMTLAKKCVLVELGVWQGRSACLLAKIAKEREGVFYGLDHFEHPGASQMAVIERLRARSLGGCGVVLRHRLGEVNWWGLPIDFLHIDADHTSPGIDRDCQNFIPHVRAGGIVAFDDYVLLASEPQYPDVRMVADVWCRNEVFEDLGSADGMQFFRRK